MESDSCPLKQIKNTAGRTAISEAQQNGHETTVEYLLSVVDPTDGNENLEEDKDVNMVGAKE